MDFLQHFLIGKPLEHNAQTSYMLSGTLRAACLRPTCCDARFAFDAETARLRTHRIPAGPGDRRRARRPMRFARPASTTTTRWIPDTLGATLGARVPHPREPHWSLAAALRADRTNYDYDNRMIDGNTRADGTPCGAAGCLYSRPADRSDDFDNVAPRVTLVLAARRTLAAVR